MQIDSFTIFRCNIIVTHAKILPQYVQSMNIKCTRIKLWRNSWLLSNSLMPQCCIHIFHAFFGTCIHIRGNTKVLKLHACKKQYIHWPNSSGIVYISSGYPAGLLMFLLSRIKWLFQYNRNSSSSFWSNFAHVNARHLLYIYRMQY